MVQHSRGKHLKYEEKSPPERKQKNNVKTALIVWLKTALLPWCTAGPVWRARLAYQRSQVWVLKNDKTILSDVPGILSRFSEVEQFSVMDSPERHQRQYSELSR